MIFLSAVDSLVVQEDLPSYLPTYQLSDSIDDGDDWMTISGKEGQQVCCRVEKYG